MIMVKWDSYCWHVEIEIMHGYAHWGSSRKRKGRKVQKMRKLLKRRGEGGGVAECVLDG